MSDPTPGDGTATSHAPHAFDLADAVVETVRTPLVVLDGDLGLVRANAAFYDAFSLQPDAVMGRSIFEAERGQLDVPELRSLLGQVLPQRNEMRDFELRAPAADGGPRFFVLNARRLELADRGRPLILLSMEDVTDRRRLEQQAQRYARDLERSNRELEDFAHAASHDLQEPLRKIRTYADRLPPLLEGPALDDRARRYLTRLSEAADRMQRRIEDLLQLARVGRTAARYERVDLDDVVTDVIEDMEIPVREQRARIEVDGLPVLECDPSQMRLLFQNLLSNALKFHREGERPVVRIFSEALPDEGRVRLVVEDEGIGFEEEYSERIFGPFQRLHGREEYEGSGVGLSLCRRIVDHHHGEIHAIGRPGEGARFEVTLPTGQPDEGLE